MDHKIYTSGGNQIIGSPVDHDCVKETKQISWTIRLDVSNNVDRVVSEKYSRKNQSTQQMQQQVTE